MCVKRQSIWLQRVAAMFLICMLTVSTVSAQTSQPDPATMRQSDSLLNGALIGAGAGVASGLFFCTLMEPWDNCKDDVGPMILTGSIGAAIGMGIDALIRRNIYASPIVSRRAKGVRFSVRF